MQKRMLFIFNPRAGKGQIKPKLMEIVDIFVKHGWEVIIYPTQRARDAYEQSRKYGNQVDMIVCSGGDGTLDEVVSGVNEVNDRLPIGYIPAGSTNDFASSLFIPKDMIKAANIIMEGHLYHCDIGKFNDTIFAYIAAFGLFTDVAYQTDQDLKNVLGHVAYVLEGVKRIFDIKSCHMKVETDEEVYEEDFIFGMVTNSRSVGGFKHLTGKNVDMNDGLFEVTLIKKPKNPLEMQEIITAILTQEDNTDMIYSFKASSLKIDSETPIPWTLDGEYGGKPTHVEIQNCHQALNIYLKNKNSKRIGTKKDE